MVNMQTEQKRIHVWPNRLFSNKIIAVLPVRRHDGSSSCFLLCACILVKNLLLGSCAGFPCLTFPVIWLGGHGRSREC